MKTHKQAFLVADLSFGDAGKGTIVDYLVEREHAHTVVRYNGGAQAAHNVVTPDGRHHTFAQFGSGTFTPGVRTYLSRFMMMEPISLLNEARHLELLGVTYALSRLFVDEEALVITPFQVAMNRLREFARGEGRHGSCGMGIGETMEDFLRFGADTLLAGDLHDKTALLRKLHFIRDHKAAQLAVFRSVLPDNEGVRRELSVLCDADAVSDFATILFDAGKKLQITPRTWMEKCFTEPGTLIFEGAQGVLLDAVYGFYPYTTWSNTTFANADALLGETAFDGAVTKVGVLRAYATRHGAGPFATEDAKLTSTTPDRHNTHNDWQREFRVGWHDLVMDRYARDVVGHIDQIALTNIDRLNEVNEWKIAESYQSGNKMISTLPVKHGADISYRAELGELLTRATPNYRVLTGGSGERLSGLIESVEGGLGKRVGILSRGPTRADKSSLF